MTRTGQKWYKQKSPETYWWLHDNLIFPAQRAALNSGNWNKYIELKEIDVKWYHILIGNGAECDDEFWRAAVTKKRS